MTYVVAKLHVLHQPPPITHSLVAALYRLSLPLAFWDKGIIAMLLTSKLIGQRSLRAAAPCPAVASLQGCCSRRSSGASAAPLVRLRQCRNHNSPTVRSASAASSPAFVDQPHLQAEQQPAQPLPVRAQHHAYDAEGRLMLKSLTMPELVGEQEAHRHAPGCAFLNLKLLSQSMQPHSFRCMNRMVLQMQITGYGNAWHAAHHHTCITVSGGLVRVCWRAAAPRQAAVALVVH